MAAVARALDQRTEHARQYSGVGQCRLTRMFRGADHASYTSPETGRQLNVDFDLLNSRSGLEHPLLERRSSSQAALLAEAQTLIPLHCRCGEE